MRNRRFIEPKRSTFDSTHYHQFSSNESLRAATESAHTDDFNSQFANYLKFVISTENEARTLPVFEQQLIEEQYFPNKPKLFLEPGAPEIFLEPGAPEIFLEPGTPEIFLEPGTPEIFLEPGSPEIFLEPGTPEIFLEPGTPEIFLEPGAPEIFLEPGTPEIFLEPGAPEIFLEPGTPEITGNISSSETRMLNQPQSTGQTLILPSFLQRIL